MTTSNLTRLLETEERLAESEERFRLLVDTIRDYAIFLLDPKGTILSWNAGAEALKGYKANEIIGRNFQTFYTQEDIDRHHPQNEIEIATRNGRYEEEGWRLRKDGSKFWANVVITRLNDKAGRLIGFAKVTRDLTERRKAEEALRQNEERLRLIFESVKDYAIIMLDPQGHIITWNEGARRLKGWAASEILGRHFSVFYSPEEVLSGKCEYELNEAAIAGRYEDEGWRVRNDGTRFWANVVITALRGNDGELKGFAKVTRDLTERKRADDKIRMAHQSLEARVSERTRELELAIKARDEFLSIASHELRTPLTTLRMQQQLLERHIQKAPEQGLSPEKTKQVAAMTGRQVSQLIRLIDDMLDVSRITSGQIRLNIAMQSISQVVLSAVESFASQLQNASMPLTLNVEPDLIVACDAQRIEQVITNLLSNAIRYASGKPLEVRVHGRGDQVEIFVRDHGPGIPSEAAKRIFERYERATSASEASGLGLGLYISQQILESHGGSIRVESTPGQGATFIVTLPCVTN
jgi:PAS domain S-box-containing protein